MIRKLLSWGTATTLLLQAIPSAAQGVPELMYYNFDVTGTSVSNLASSPVGANPASLSGTTLSIGGTGEFSTTGLLGTGGNTSSNYMSTNWGVNFSNSSWTISAYANLPSTAGNSYFFGDGLQSAGPLNCFWVTNGTTSYIRLRGLSTTSSPFMLDINNPTFPIVLHYVYDYNLGIISAYTNGVFHSSVTIGQQSFVQSNTNKFYVGSSNENNYISILPLNPPVTISGTLDEFRMYNRALGQSEITATWNQPLPLGPCTTAPDAGSAIAAQSGICAGSNANLDLVANTVCTGQIFTWQESATNTPGSYMDVTLASPTSNASVIPSNNTSYFRCVVMNGSQSDTSSPIVITLNHPISGTYTINSMLATGGTNFQSFNDAVSRLKCGVNGPIFLNVVSGSGPYNEQVVFENIPGLSESAPLILNGNGETLTYLSTNSNQRSILKLSGMNYTTVKNLNITATAPAANQYVWGINIANNSNNVIIDSCTINIGFTSTQNSTVGIAVNSNLTSTTIGNSFADSVTISNCKITGGYNGITMIGDATNKLLNNRIIKNDIQDFYSYGMYLGGTDSLLVKGNDLHRNTLTNGSTFYGIAMSGTNATNTRITGNKIHNTAGATSSLTSNSFGIYFSSVDASSGSENIVENNIIYDFNNASGTASALYNSGSDGTHFYHNTVSLDHTAATGGATHGFYQSSTASNINLQNNIISVTRGGNGIKYCYYYNTATTTTNIISNANDLYLAPTGMGTANLVRYAGTDYLALSNWAAATSNDASSFSVNPLFQNPSTGDFEPLEPSLNNQGIAVAFITTDIFNNPRSSVAPDLGAIENAQFPLSLQLLEFTAVSKNRDAVINWSVSEDKSVIRYEIQKSQGGKVFESIGDIKSNKFATTAAYEYVDKNAWVNTSSKVLYYRLKIIGSDKVEYSSVAALSLQAKATVKAYPNPFKDRMTIEVMAGTNETCQIQLIDIQGKIVSVQETTVSTGKNLIELNDLAKLPSGIYQISVYVDESIYRFKMTK
jgi:hypothetical protein